MKYYLIVLITLSISCDDKDIKDVIPPSIVEMTPMSNATDITINTKIEVIFSERIDETSIDDNTIQLTDYNGHLVPGEYIYKPDSLKLIFIPATHLTFNKTYTVLVSSSIHDLALNPLPATSWQFLTASESGPAQYELTFTATWSNSTHPTDFPSNAHFSGLIGMTHSQDTALFYPGTFASVGIKDMAEIGSKTNLTAIVNSIISKGKAENLISGGGISPSPGIVSHQFDITQAFPVISVTSMIAPSPDWFVAVHDIKLYQDGQWIKDITLNVLSYDAGTDSGQTFTSPNEVSNPVENIHLIVDAPLGSYGVVQPLGTMRFLRIQ